MNIIKLKIPETATMTDLMIASEFCINESNPNAWICGGAVRRAYMGLSVFDRDFDVFSEDFDKVIVEMDRKAHSIWGNYSNTKEISNSVTNKNKSPITICSAEIRRSSYSHLVEANVIASFYRNDSKLFKIPEKVVIKYQIVNRSFKTLQDVFSGFDFTVCQFATDGKYIYATKEALSDIQDMRLRFSPTSPNPSHKLPKRIVKYCLEGFIPDKEVFELNMPKNEIFKDYQESINDESIFEFRSITL